MLPRMRAATAAPSSGAGASPWPATAGTPRWPAAVSAIPTRACRWPRSARWPAWARSRPADVEAALAAGRRRSRRRAVEVAPAARGTGTRSVAARRRHRRAGRSRPARRGRRRLVPGRAAPPAGGAGRWRATATEHGDARCREAAVAALGAIGDPAGLPAVLAALGDKPTVRRRATVALAGFDDPRVTPALRGAGRGPRLAGAPGGRGAARRALAIALDAECPRRRAPR